ALGEPKWAQWVKGEGDDFRRLGASKDREAVEPLVWILADVRRWRDRRAAAKALGQLGDPRAVERLVRALADGDNDVRCAAAEALAALGEPKWAQWVKGEGDDFRRLGASKDREAVEPLVWALADGDNDVRRAAAKALAALGEPKWAQWIKGEGDDFRRLGELGDARTLKPLVKALRDENWDVRRAAARALVGISGTNPDSLKPHWREVAQLVREPHTDSHTDSDCQLGHSDRKDRGIGLDFPEPPARFAEGAVSDVEKQREETFVLVCPGCGKKLKAPRRLAGRPSCCPACGTAIQIPADPDTGSDVKPDF
ncbi:MAG TPA: HEAT repeat domain-containing protein, partial [Thermoguttaceae bacterium]|nr:HEAT repeat domain-containing protein [Thermoguttaceae bacterium]